MATKKVGFLSGLLRNMTSRMSKKSRVQPLAIPSETIVDELAQLAQARREARRESRRKSRAKTPAERAAERKEKSAKIAAERKEKSAKIAAEREEKARMRASRPKVPSPEAQEIVRQHLEVLATIAHCSREMERLKTESDAKALEVMEEFKEAQEMLDKIKEKKGGKKSRTHRKPKRARK
jgi:hypothetical protein